MPGVEAEVVVVAAGRDEQGARIAADRHVEAEHVAVERLGLARARRPGDGRGRSSVPAGRPRAVRVPRRSSSAEQRRRGRAASSPSGAGPSRSRPLGARPVAVDLDPVAVRVGQVQRLADQVVGRAVERPAGLGQPGQRQRQVTPRSAIRIARWNRPVARRSSAGAPRRRAARRAARRPPVRAPPCRRRCSTARQTDRALVERAGARQIRDREADGADPCGGIDRDVANQRRSCSGHRHRSLRCRGQLARAAARARRRSRSAVASLEVGERRAPRRSAGAPSPTGSSGLEHARRRSRAPCGDGPEPRWRRSR